jgi:hypothetical protein
MIGQDSWYDITDCFQNRLATIHMSSSPFPTGDFSQDIISIKEPFVLTSEGEASSSNFDILG